MGYTGCGKSTMIKLILKEYKIEPGEGNLTLGGIDIKDVSARYVMCTYSWLSISMYSTTFMYLSHLSHFWRSFGIMFSLVSHAIVDSIHL